MARIYPPPLERLLAGLTYEPNTGCWLWVKCSSNGYGLIYVMGKNKHAHRLAYEELVGPIPEGLDIDHLCRVRACCNPAHLEPVTRGVNISRGMLPTMARERFSKITHCPQGHAYDEKNTYFYKGSERSCRACSREHQKRYERKKRALAKLSRVGGET
jgi:hypothetical protein